MNYNDKQWLLANIYFNELCDVVVLGIIAFFITYFFAKYFLTLNLLTVPFEIFTLLSDNQYQLIYFPMNNLLFGL